MTPNSAAIPAPGVFKRAGVWEMLTLLSLAWLVPFALHLVPWDGDRPLGVHLVPVFWTAFVAVYLYGLRTGLVVALFAPAVNLIITGLPAWERISLMSFELAVFAVVAWAAVRRAPQWWGVAPLAWLCARVGYTVVKIAQGSAMYADAGYFLEAVIRTLPGLAVLLAINFALTRLYPKSEIPEGDQADRE